MSYTIDSNLKAGIEMLAEGKSNKKALQLINKSAQSGKTKGKSYFEIGRILREGVNGIEPNPEEARRYYDKAMEIFLHSPCDSMDHREMGDYYHYGLGFAEVDLNRALEYCDMAANEGDELAKQNAEDIRNMLRKGNASKAPVLSPETTVKETPVTPEEVRPAAQVKPVAVAPKVVTEEKPAEKEDPLLTSIIDSEQLTIKALRLLDSISSNRQDKLDGVELAKAAAEKGSARAAFLVGFLYEGDNSLVEKDLNTSKVYYDMAVELGSASAMFRLGILYTDSDSPFFDLNKGHELILKSAHAGYSWALAHLGDCFRQKVSDPRNLDLAYRYYAMAGERGLGLGYHNMAEIDTSRQQLELAKEHEKLAMQNGYDPSLGYQDPLFYSLHI